jgi:hypothetical protein
MVITTSRAETLLGGMFFHRNTAPIITNRDAVILIDRDEDLIAYTSQSFIDRIIDHLIYQVMQRFDIGTAHIHTGAAPDSFKPSKT